MEDKYDPTKEELNKLFDKFDKAKEMLDEAGKIIDSSKIPVEEQLEKRFVEITTKVIEDFYKEYDELGIFQKYHFIVYTILNLWANQTVNSLVTKSLTEGAPGSEEFKEAIAKYLESDYEKELSRIVETVKQFNPDENNKNPISSLSIIDYAPIHFHRVHTVFLLGGWGTYYPNEYKYNLLFIEIPINSDIILSFCGLRYDLNDKCKMS